MMTNQSAVPEHFRPEEARCEHAPGCAEETNCAYLRALGRLRAWTNHAEAAHRQGLDERRVIGDLWRIQAELACALDRCPNLVYVAPGAGVAACSRAARPEVS